MKVKFSGCGSGELWLLSLTPQGLYTSQMSAIQVYESPPTVCQPWVCRNFASVNHGAQHRSSFPHRENALAVARGLRSSRLQNMVPCVVGRTHRVTFCITIESTCFGRDREIEESSAEVARHWIKAREPIRACVACPVSHP